MSIKELLFKESFPRGEVSICGANTDKNVFWNFIHSELKDSELSTDNNAHVIKRYFGKKTESAKVSRFIALNICKKQKPQCDSCPLKYNCEQYKNKRTSKTDISFADFFCGAGGLSLGFELSGLTPKLANDIDPWFMSTYAFNRTQYEIEMTAGDIDSWILANKYRRDWGIDVITGGVPCQSFSNANRQRKENDPRDKLYRSLLQTVKIIKPKAVVIENVSGMLKEFNGVIKDLNRLGFSADFILLNSNEFGIPQNRKRLFFIAVSKNQFKRSDEIVARIISGINNAKESKSVNLKEAINDLPVLSAHTVKNNPGFNNNKSGKSFIIHNLQDSSEYVKKINSYRSLVPLFNHKARYNNERDVEIFGRLKPGENSLTESIKDIMPYSNRNDIFKDKYYKLRYNHYCKTITAHMRFDCNMYIHPEQARGLTAREAARVQGFPDDYAFVGTFQRLYQQIGNAVPPFLAKAIGDSIKQNLK